MRLRLRLRLRALLQPREQVDQARLGDREAPLAQLLDDRRAARVLAEDHGAVAADPLRLERLVGERVGEDPVGVDPGLVREGVVADQRLVGGDRHPRQLLDQPRELVQLLRPDTGRVLVEGLQRHHDLLQRRVPRALAEPVDADVRGGDPRLDGGERIRGREAEIVVAVNRELLRVDPPGKLFEVPPERRRRHHADRVGDDEAVRPGVLDSPVEPLDEVERGADRVLGDEGDVQPGVLGTPDRGERRREDLVLRHLQLELEVDLARGDKDRDVRRPRVDHRLDVLRHRAGGGEDLGPQPGGGDKANGTGLFGRDDRDPRVEHADADLRQELGDLQLLLRREAYPGGLLAVPQGLVPKDEVLGKPAQPRGVRMVILDEGGLGHDRLRSRAV